LVYLAVTGPKFNTLHILSKIVVERKYNGRFGCKIDLTLG